MKKTLDIVLNRRHVVFIFEVLSSRRRHFATDDCFGPSTRSTADLHVSHKTNKIPRKYPEDLKKFFTRDIPKYSEGDSSIEITHKIDTYIKRKISLSLTFQIHCSSSHKGWFSLATESES